MHSALFCIVLMDGKVGSTTVTLSLRYTITHHLNKVYKLYSRKDRLKNLTELPKTAWYILNKNFILQSGAVEF